MFEKRQRLIAMARRWDELAGKNPPDLMVKKQVSLEALLQWAYFEELPKAEIRRAKPLREFRQRWASIANFGDYIAPVERRSCNLWGSFQGFDQWGEMHEDALAVAKAVDQLDSQIHDLPDGWNPFSDFPGSGPEADELRSQVLSRVKVSTRKGRSALRFKPSALVFNYTILGGWPKWEAQSKEAADFKQLSRDQAIAVGQARAEYEIWRISLAYLSTSLATQLVKHELLPTLPPIRPWEAAPGAQKRILPVLHQPLVDWAKSA